MSLIDLHATQTVGLRRKVGEVAGWGDPIYEPEAPDAPEKLTCVYEPSYRIDGPRYRGRVTTRTKLHLGDLIIGDLTLEPEEPKEITDVASHYDFDGTLEYYEALF